MTYAYPNCGRASEHVGSQWPRLLSDDGRQCRVTMGENREEKPLLRMGGIAEQFTSLILRRLQTAQVSLSAIPGLVFVVLCKMR